MAGYQPESYKGYRVTFKKELGGLVWAKVPEISKKQYLGSGKTKTQAFNDCKSTMNHLFRVGTFKPKN